MLKISITDLLATHTQGQIRLMAIASLVNYQNLKYRIDKDTKKPPVSSSQPQAPMHQEVDATRPSKPFSKMTKAEMELYYLQQGFKNANE